MIVSQENKYSIETDPEFNVHDAYFTGLHFDYEKNELHFKCQSSSHTGWFFFRFENVYAFEMSAGDWWGGGDLRILEWTVVKDNQMIRRLWLENAAKLSSFDVSPPIALRPSDMFRLSDPDLALETQFLFSRGNILTIACEMVEFVPPAKS